MLYYLCDFEQFLKIKSLIRSNKPRQSNGRQITHSHLRGGAYISHTYTYKPHPPHPYSYIPQSPYTNYYI